MVGGSMVAGVSADDVEKVRAAVLALEGEGQQPTVRSIRARAGVGQAAAQAVARAYREGKLPPAAQGPWTSAPWAAHKDAKRREQEARDLRRALQAMLGYVHDDGLAALAAAMWDLPVDLRRVAASVGGFTQDELEGHTLGAEPICTVGQWLEGLERVDAQP